MKTNAIPALAKAKWKSSGLSDAHAKRLRLKPLTGSQTAALGSNFHAVGSLLIPYFDLKGKPTKFFRVRYLEPLPGFLGQMKKPQRYAQLKGDLNEVYLPPLFQKTWEDIGKDTSTEIYITEGELKAAAGCAAGLAVIGLGGVDTWKSAKRGIDFFPALKKIEWKNRQVRIVYDSDLATKPDVIRAQRALAQELLARGAFVEVVSLPAGPPDAEGNPGKVGLDDYLVANGADALKALVEEATPYAESDALWGLNEDVIYIKSMDSIIERATGNFYERTRFTHGVYANRHYMEEVVKKKQVSLVKKPLAPRWIGWEHRAEVDSISYEPGKPQEWDGKWNVWPGFGCEPKKGDIGPWNWLMDFVFGDDHKARRWFEQWLAYPLQHPGAKLYSSCLFWSREHGTGKSFIAYIMQRIYGKNFAEIKSKDLKGNFNSWAKNRQFIYGDEINSKESKVDADWLKGLITQPEVTIEEKFLPKYVVTDHMNYYFASNHPDALFIEDKDRRFFVWEIRRKPASRDEYRKVDEWLKQHDGASHLFRYLLDLKLAGFDPLGHAPETEGKRGMIMLGKTDVQLWVQLLKDDPKQALKALGENVAAECDLFTPERLFRAFDPEGRSRSNAAGLGRALAAAGFRQMNHNIPIRTHTGLHRIYPVRDLVKWEQATKQEIVEHFDRFWSPDSAERKI